MFFICLISHRYTLDDVRFHRFVGLRGRTSDQFRWQCLQAARHIIIFMIITITVTITTTTMTMNTWLTEYMAISTFITRYCRLWKICMMMVVPINTNNHYHHQNIRMMMITMLVMTFGTTLYHHRLGPIFFCSTGHSSALPRRAEADPCTVRWQQGAAHGESSCG